MHVRPTTRALTAFVLALGLALAAVPALAAAPSPAWTKQFGSANHDHAGDVAVDGAGRIHVVGYTLGSVTGWPNRGQADAFVRVLKPDGKKAWTKQFGTIAQDEARGVALDRSGNVYVAGSTYGSLSGPAKGQADAFVRKYRRDGKKAWTKQFGTSAQDEARGVALDRSGYVYVVGTTTGSLSGTSKGSLDAFVRKFKPNGKVAWTRQFGTSGVDRASGVAVDRSGNVYVVGYTTGPLGGPAQGASDAFVRKLKPNGKTAWTRQFGTKDSDEAIDVAVDRLGRVYVVGATTGSLAGPPKGSWDPYVRKYKPNGASPWTHHFGTPGSDIAHRVAVDRLGRVYVAGSTNRSLPGPWMGSTDVFVRRYLADGTKGWKTQFGSTSGDLPQGLAVDSTLRLVVAGETSASITGWPSRGGNDVFVRKYKR